MRIPNPSDMRPAGLEPARGIAQINENVAGRIGQAGRAMGNALEAVGSAFADVGMRQAAAEDATNLARAKLDWYKFDNEAWTGLQNSVGEDGSGWENAASVYDRGRQDIASRYPINDPRKREELNLYFEHQIASRGFQAARQKQAQAGAYYRGIEDKEIDGAVARIEANPSQGTVDAMRGPLGELVESGRGIYHSEATIEKRKREIEGRLLMGQYRGLIKQDPEAAAELFKRIQEGSYEIDQPRPMGGQSSLDIKPAGGGHAILTSESGARFRVSEQYADRFAGLVSDLEAASVKIDGSQSGGFADRNIAGTNTKSRHAFGEAIDLNWNDNARGKEGKIRDVIPAEQIRQIAARHGLKWGGDWNNPDDMHFEVDRNADYKPSGDRPTAGGLAPKLTAYSPQRGGSEMEGGYESSKPGPDGKSEVRTLEDYQSGASKYITIAGDPSQYGKTYTIPRIEWIDSNGKRHVSENVTAVVHDTGGAFKGKGESRFDIPVAKDLTNEQMNAQPFLKGGVKFVAQGDAAAKPVPVSERSLTRYAGLKSSTASDAVVIGETPAKGQDAPANDNAGDGEGIGGLVSEIRGIAKEAPGLPLSEVLDRETLVALADRFPEVASIDDFDNATVSDAIKAMEGAASDRTPGGRGMPPRADNLSPMGRLVSGQTFTVKSKVGDITVSADSLNALDRGMLKKLQAEAKEMTVIRQREGEAIAEDVIRKQLLTLESTGKSHSEFDPKLLAEVYRKNPKKIAEYERRAAIATQVHEATADAVNLPDDILESRLDKLRSSIIDGAGDADPTTQAALDRAEKRIKGIISVRERDPARAVRESREVAEVLQQIPGGEPKNKAHLFQIADATIKAQTRLGIPVVPITKSEARTIMADITFAPENKKREVAQETAKKVMETYGSLAPQVMSAAAKLASGDTRDDDDLLSSAMKRAQRQSTIKDVDAAVGATGSKKQDRVPSAPNYFDKFDRTK